jgi:hypothetical protein
MPKRIYIEPMILPIIEISIHASIIATVYVFLMVGRGGFMKWVPGLVDRVTKNKLMHKLFYQCPVCIAFEIALWWTFIITLDIGLSVITAFYAAFISFFIEYVFKYLEE